MAFCATCVHWQAEDPQHLIAGFGCCTRVRRAVYDPDPEIVDELAVVIEGSGHVSALKCKVAFGCVLHEAAES